MFGFREQRLAGFEAEFHLIDGKGLVSDKADVIIKEMTGQAKKECAKGMIEIASKPYALLADSMGDLLEKIRLLVSAAEKHMLHVYPYSTYPGSFDPEMRKEAAYRIKERIFGKERWKIAGRCTGFHFHYTLPRGIFSRFSRNMRLLLNPSLNQRTIDSYNMMVAMDPALCAFLQSSPFYQGRLCGKDARMMFYRGNRLFGVEGLYSEFQEFGALPPYRHTVTSLIYQAEDRFGEWSRKMRILRLRSNALSVYGAALDTNWSPIKVNSIGTFEMRGMDMSTFSNMLSASVIIVHVLKEIGEGRLTVSFSESADEPFRTEDGVLFIPPFDFVDRLQLHSAKRGMGSKEVRRYCKALLDFCSISPANRKLLQIFEKMTEDRETVADRIIKKARGMGATESLENEQAAELSLKFASGMAKETEKAEKLISRLSNIQYG
ncbi:MAG: hypothetical protein HYX24_06305 [Candidatus Aenigmarchaeota archaeon]|nr:hypothetical protein [Candidatus Aenigmarchaeota archaeon]